MEHLRWSWVGWVRRQSQRVPLLALYHLNQKGLFQTGLRQDFCLVRYWGAPERLYFLKLPDLFVSTRRLAVLAGQ
jgi:hypothetical protein